MRNKSIYLLSIMATTITGSFASPDTQDAIDDSFTTRIERTLQRKIQEQQTNDAVYKSILTNPDHQSITEAWATFLDQQRRFMAGVALSCPDKSLLIHTSDPSQAVELDVHDLSTTNYTLLEHTTAFSIEKAPALKRYILAQNSDVTPDATGPRAHFDIVPLLSASVIDPTTGGYTHNCCNSGSDMQVHLILDTDPRAPVQHGPGDIYSPARRAINAFLHNQETKRKDGSTETRATLRGIFRATTSPEALLKATICDFNEVVLMGNPSVEMLPDGKRTRILGIGLSQYWLNTRSRSASPESIQALKDLAETTGLPLVYYDPKTPRDYHGTGVFLIGKGTPQPQIKFFQSQLQTPGSWKLTLRNSLRFNFLGLCNIDQWICNDLSKCPDVGAEEAKENFTQRYEEIRQDIQRVDRLAADARPQMLGHIKAQLENFNTLFGFLKTAYSQDGQTADIAADYENKIAENLKIIASMRTHYFAR